MAKAKPNYKDFVEGQLECSVCLETVKDPQTLQGCFHSFCSTCLNRLLQKEGGPQPGVTCPVCRKFSRRDNIQANFFIKNLADMHLAHTERRSCEQCPEDVSDASSKCLDCKMLLCESCKAHHLKIKLLQSHRILPLSEDTELIVDQLVFCSKHPDKPIELYCEPCKKAVCIMCSVTTHRGHDCQTIQATLDNMVPQWENNISIIDEKIAAINKSSGEVDKKIEETKSEYNRCAAEIDRKTDQRIAEIRNTQNTMKQELRSLETEEVEKLERVRRVLEEKRRDGENVMRVVRTSLDRARHASLLAELLQEGLGSRCRDMVEWGEEAVGSVRVSLPAAQGGDTVWDGVKEGMLGRVVYQVTSVLMAVNSVVAPKLQEDSRQWNVDARGYFNRKFKPSTQINLGGECTRFAVIGEHIWVPVYIIGLSVYDKGGNLLKKFGLANAKAVQQASNGDIVIACRGGAGLNVVIGLESDVHQIAAGSYPGVSCHNHKIYSFQLYQTKIKTYSVDNENNEQNTKWKLEKTTNVKLNHSSDTFLVHQANGNESVKFYVCHPKTHVIKEYNEEGICNKTFGGLSYQAYICGIDSQSNIIIASSTGFLALDTATSKITDLGTLGLDINFKFYDARLDIDGSMWVLYSNNNGEYRISKLELE